MTMPKSWNMTPEERRAKFGHGPRPKPVELKILEGNPGHDKLNYHRPKPPPTRVEPPVELGRDALLEWKRLEDELFNLGLLTSVDKGALASYCETWGNWICAVRAWHDFLATDPPHGGFMLEFCVGNPNGKSFVFSS